MKYYSLFFCWNLRIANTFPMREPSNQSVHPCSITNFTQVYRKPFSIFPPPLFWVVSRVNNFDILLSRFSIFAIKQINSNIRKKIIKKKMSLF